MSLEEDKKGAKAQYPHRNTPSQGKLKYSDFNLPGCAQDSSSDDKKSKFEEYIIVPGNNAWAGGSVSQGNDRVLFQYIDDKTAAYCGIMTHTLNSNGNPSGKDFELCT